MEFKIEIIMYLKIFMGYKDATEIFRVFLHLFKSSQRETYINLSLQDLINVSHNLPYTEIIVIDLDVTIFKFNNVEEI